MFIQGKAWGHNVGVYKQLISWGISLNFRDQQGSKVQCASSCCWNSKMSMARVLVEYVMLFRIFIFVVIFPLWYKFLPAMTPNNRWGNSKNEKKKTERRCTCAGSCEAVHVKVWKHPIPLLQVGKWSAEIRNDRLSARLFWQPSPTLILVPLLELDVP